MEHDEHLRQAAASLRQALTPWAQALTPTARRATWHAAQRLLAILRQQDARRGDDG